MIFSEAMAIGVGGSWYRGKPGRNPYNEILPWKLINELTGNIKPEPMPPWKTILENTRPEFASDVLDIDFSERSKN